MTEAALDALAGAQPQDGVVPAGDAGLAEDQELGRAFDRIVTQNGAERGEDGRFASRNGEAAEGEQATESDGAEAAADAGEQDAAAAIQPAPEHLPQAIKAAWEKIPAEARTAITHWQAEVGRKFGEQGRMLQAVKPIADRLNEAVTKFEDFRGMTPDQLAQGALELAAVQSRLNRAPVDTLIEIAEHYGALDGLKARLSGQAAPAEGQQVQQLNQTIRQLQQKVDELSDPNRVDEHISTSMQRRDAAKALDDFAKGKEFYADVEDQLPAFIQMAWQVAGEGASMQDVLDTAYDMAVNAIPAVREKARAAEAKKAAQTDPKRTEAARKGQSVNVKSASNGKERPPSDEEAMASAYDRVMAR